MNFLLRRRALSTFGIAVAAMIGLTQVQARIVADPNAPGNQRPIVFDLNGVQLVNIQTPSPAGVSRNVYRQFDVDGAGAILNNSRIPVQSQLGGYLARNEWLARGSARVILNEVNSSSPSYLRGYVEVAGPKAEVIIANPSGIQVQGGGFINASRVTLTTGAPQLDAFGGIESYRVTGGAIGVSGAGLDASGTEFAALYARMVSINAGVHGAGELRVVTGANRVGADGAPGVVASVAPIAGTGPTPPIAFDSGALGGMYAQKIWIMGTEAGVGARNAGTIQTGAGDSTLMGLGELAVTSSGHIENIGTMQAAGNASIAAPSFANSGTLLSAGSTRVTTRGDLRNAGTIEGRRIDLASTAGDVSNSGTMRQTSMAALTLAAPTLANINGGTIGHEPVTESPGAGAGGAGETDPSLGGATGGNSGGNATPDASARSPAGPGGDNPASTPIATVAPGSITAAGAIRNDGGHVYAGSAIDLQTPTVINAGGRLELSSLAVTGPTFSNAGGTLNVANGFQAKVAHFDNSGGKLTAGNLDIATTGDLLNQDGTLASNGDLKLDAGGVLDNTRGTIGGGTDLAIRAGDLNNSGALRATKDADIAIDGQLVNDGSITAGRNVAVSASTLQGGAAGVLGAGIRDDGNFGSGGDLHVTTTGALVARGQNLSAGEAILKGASIDVSAGTTSASNIGLVATQGNVTTSGATVVTPGILSVTANTASGQSLVNDKGVLNNSDGRIEGRSIEIKTAGIDNTRGHIVADAEVAISASGEVRNTGGTILAGSKVAIDAASLGFNGQLLSQGDMRLALATDVVIEAGGTTLADGNLSIATTGDIRNEGKLGAGNELLLDARNIDNAATGEIQGRTTTLKASDTVTNRGVIDGEATRIDAATLNNLGTGRIYGDRVSIKAGTVLNDAETVDGIISAGTIAARQRLDIGAGTLKNRNGALILSAEDLHIGGDLDAQGNATGTMALLENHAASIESMGNMSIATGVLNNTNGGVTHRMETAPAGEARTEYSVFGDPKRYQKDEIVFVSVYSYSLWPMFFSQEDVLPPGDYTSGSNYYGILVPSARYPLSRFRYYYENPPLNSADLHGQRYVSVDQTEDYMEPGTWYAATDPIWAAFGVVPPPVDLPEDSVGRLDPDITVGQTGYEGIDPRTSQRAFVYFDHPVTQEDYDNTQAYLEAHRNLDAATGAFIQDVRNNASLAYTTYTTTDGGSMPVLETSAPGRIISGGTMDIAVGSGTNDMSQILAGSTLTVTGGEIVNKNIEVQGEVTQTGTEVFSKPGSSGRTFEVSPYNLTVPITVTLEAARQEGNVAPGGGAPIDPRAPSQAAPGAAPGAPGTSAPVKIIEVKAAGDSGQVTRTTSPNAALPTASLFRTRAEPTSRFLIETDPRFANYRNWLSSDYLLSNLGLDPNYTLKRLGDGFYEQRLIREQVAQLTGFRYLDGYDSDEEQYAALMNAGVTFAQQFNLAPGIALTDVQMAQLTSDIVWLVEQTVTLPDGSTQRVLVPQLYVRVKPGDIDGTGALLAGENVKLDMKGDVTTSGIIAGRKAVSITAENIGVLNGRVSGDKVGLSARNDIDIIGGTVDARSAAVLDAGRDLNVRSTTTSGSTTSVIPGAINQRSATIVDRVAGIYVSNPEGVLVASAGNDANLIGAVISNSGKGGSIEVTAGHDINLGTVTTSSQETTVRGPANFRAESRSQEVGTRIVGAGGIGLYAHNDINTRAAAISSTQGDVTLAAVHNINIEAGESSVDSHEMAHETRSSTFSSKTMTAEVQSSRTRAIGSDIGGRTVTVVAGNDIAVRGSSVVSDQGTTLVAGRNVNIESVTESTSSHTRKETSSSGAFSSGTALTFGEREELGDTRGSGTTAAGSTVGSIAGNVSIVAGNRYTQIGSDVVAPAGDVNILAKDVRITEARETTRTHTEQSFKQSGISVGVSSPMLDAGRAIVDLADASGNTDNSRMQALNTAAMGATAYNGLNSAQLAQKQAAEAGSGSPLAGKFTVTGGSSRSQSTSDRSANTARSSTVHAGGDVNIMAIGGGADSSILIQGNEVSAGRNANFVADNKIELQAAQDTGERNGSNSSSGWSAGVGFASGSQNGITLEAAANRASGSSEGAGTSYTNTHVTARNQVNMISGGDTTLRGAVVSANQVNALVGGNLTIESLQDKSTSFAQQRDSGFSASVCVYPLCTGESYASANASNTRANGNYASVTEQSGIKAGDGGFNVHVAGNTNLVGGVIESTRAAVDGAKNSFSTASLSTSDIGNFDVQKGSGWSASASSDGTKPNGSSAGIGDIDESQQSVTRSGISGFAADQSVRTGDNSSVGALANRWNEQRAMQELAAQQQITAAFGASAASAWGNYANEQLKNAQTEEDKACWSASGPCRTAGHTVIGGWAGGAGGAFGGGVATQLAGTIDQAVTGAGLTGAAHDAVVAGLTSAMGAALGGAAGATGAYNEVTNNYLSSTQVREMMSELREAKTHAERDKILTDYADLSARQSAASKGCAPLCDLVAADARAGKQALDAATSEFKSIAGGPAAEGHLLGTQKNDSQFFFSLGNGWLDPYGNTIDISMQMRQGGRDMANAIATGASYVSSGCALAGVCAPAVPFIAGVGFYAGLAGSFVFDFNPLGALANWGTDEAVKKLGNTLRVPSIITTPIAEGLKDSKEYDDWRNRQSLDWR